MGPPGGGPNDRLVPDPHASVPLNAEETSK